MNQYRRVSYGVRCQIYAYLQAQIPIPEIARRLGFHKTTIYRELKRNGRQRYAPQAAQIRASRRYALCRRPYVVTMKMEKLIEKLLREDWSPQQMSGRLVLENQPRASHQTIYNFVNQRRELYILLKRYNKRGAGRIRQRSLTKREGFMSIHQRPEIANQRKRIGDWERDTMQTLNRNHWLVCTDRKSRYVKLAPTTSLKNEAINKLTRKMLKEGGHKIYSMTNDNGKEFRKNLNWGVPTYFCDPRRPQQRGTVENTIGLLRRYVSRKTDTKDWGLKEAKWLEKKLNLRPRKVLGYKTPYEVYFNRKVALAV